MNYFLILMYFYVTCKNTVALVFNNEKKKSETRLIKVYWYIGIDKVIWELRN